MLKKILLASIFVITAITTVTYAEDDMKTVASKAYVDTQIETKQLKIPAAGQPNVGAGETVMTYTATGNGQIGERGLYSDISSYNATTDGDKLITASALNATFTNLPTTPTTKLECANSPACTLWTIVDQTAYAIQLPDGYTRLEYIESTGTQYIDTKVNIGKNIQTKVKFGKTTNSFTKFGFVIGGGNHYQGLVTRTSENSYYMSMYSPSQNTVTLTIPDDVFEVTFNTPEHKVIINNADSFDLVLISPYEINTTIGVFNSPGGSGNYIGIGKVYSFVITNNLTNAMLFNGIPVRRESDGEIGMYDLADSNPATAFHTNAGTGVFTAGPVVN